MFIESQKEVNWIKEVTFSNEKLRYTKRKAEVQTLSIENFKRRKMHEVGNRGLFETDKRYGYETAGLLGGFPDILGTQLSERQRDHHSGCMGDQKLGKQFQLYRLQGKT